MPRFPRKHINTHYFHVITQGINKSYIFEKEEDIKFYIKTMYYLQNKQKINIIAYCIMNNHAHILINTESVGELSKYMQRLNTIYARYYNGKYKRVGYVFKDRYKSEGIYNRQHLYNCIKYIYENPVKAGICDKAEDYMYSNYIRVNIKINKNYKIMDVDEKEDICREIIKQFLEKNNIGIEDLIKDRNALKQLIIKLKEENNISLRKISQELKISRETIRRIYNQ